MLLQACNTCKTSQPLEQKEPFKHEVEGVWILGMVERSLQRRIFYFLYPLEKMNFKTN